MKLIAVCILFLLPMSIATATPLPSAVQIIRETGQLAFTDGSSYYVFNKDKTFSSGPMGWSGRTISGHWQGQDDDLTVEGRWAWMNGGSRMDDFRRMTLTVCPEVSQTKSQRLMTAGTSVSVRLCRCYFVVNELVANSATKGSSPFPAVSISITRQHCAVPDYLGEEADPHVPSVGFVHFHHRLSGVTCFGIQARDVLLAG